ncbi:trafficking regulator of GLUT4 1-like [Salvelinus alpinus]|uniref:trafficking regulator of GLUT4 1-like n=1 Tax=Salvelinus fontinalis TaxID=8038 RepID=UPI002485A2C6|nr:trafficking regulator of GLUT4 1-like [Salvelinus fontinalis]
MAINTDTEFEKSKLGKSGGAPANESQETEKLLSLVTTEPAGGNRMKMSSSFTINVGSENNLDADQNGHSVPFRSGSAGHLAAAPPSPSRVSLSRSRTSSIGNAAVQEAQKPKDYLILVILSCFCPFWPVSIVALAYSIMSRNSLQSGDLDGAKRLGKLARLLSVVSIILGILTIVVCVTVSVTK